MCFELFRCIPLKVDWSFNSPRASQGPPKGLPRASQGPPCLSIQTKLSAQSSEPQGLRTLHHTELYSWLPRSHGDKKSLKLRCEKFIKVYIRSVSVVISVISGHDVFTNCCWKAYNYMCECLVLRFRQCCWASVCDFEVCLACSMCSCKGRISSY